MSRSFCQSGMCYSSLEGNFFLAKTTNYDTPQDEQI